MRFSSPPTSTPRKDAIGDALLFASHLDTEEGRDLLARRLVRDGALAGRQLGVQQPLRERQATGLAAGPAVVAREQVLHHLEARVLLHAQEAVGRGQDGREDETQPRHDGDAGDDLRHESAVLAS
jgi:hypothetical protein